ncbi:MAG: SPOR domain-containing protein [Treponema sp.]|jgi:hypothetical protein|nr:SPOR domain-containing protein [Treponema sp.]
MKSVFKLAAIVVIYFFTIGVLIGASIWEGSAKVAPVGVLLATGYYAATNAFPKNTVIIVTNLENGKTTRVTVTATLDNSSYSSFLILLSKEAADAIALPESYPGRVRIMEAIDPVTMLSPLENKISNGDPDYDPMALINSDRRNSQVPVVPENAPSSEESPSSNAVVTTPDNYESPLAAGDGTNEGTPPGPSEETAPAVARVSEPAPIEAPSTAAAGVAPEEHPPPVPPPIPSPIPIEKDSLALAEDGERAPIEAPSAAAGVALEEQPPPVPPPIPSPVPIEEDSLALAEDGESAPIEAPAVNLGDYNLVLVPAERRVPEGKDVIISSDEQVTPISERQEQKQDLDPASFIPAIEDDAAIAAAQAQNSTHMSFSVPIITTMEKSMYYVQLRSYGKPELVESELVKVGKQHNVSVQVTEVSGRRLYRILIGPVSRSESDQLLQQYKARGWNDAFVWLGK